MEAESSVENCSELNYGEVTLARGGNLGSGTNRRFLLPGWLTDFREDSDLVDLSDDGVEDFTLERPEDDGLVLHRIHYKASIRLDQAVPD